MQDVSLYCFERGLLKELLIMKGCNFKELLVHMKESACTACHAERAAASSLNGSLTGGITELSSELLYYITRESFATTS